MNNLSINNEFYDKYRDYVMSVLNDKGFNKADDLTQDVFEAAMINIDYYNNDFKGSITNWINLLVIHVIDRHKRSKDIMNVDLYMMDFDDNPEASVVTEEDLLNPTSNHYYTKNSEEVNMYIRMLPDKQQAIVYSRLVLGYTYEEISKDLSTNARTAQSNFDLGIKNLRKLIDSDKPEDELLPEVKLLKPYGDKAYAGDWAWRIGESADRSNSKVRVLNPSEVKEYCQKNNLMYAN